jgi:hypothetical protein
MVLATQSADPNSSDFDIEEAQPRGHLIKKPDVA